MLSQTSIATACLLYCFTQAAAAPRLKVRTPESNEPLGDHLILTPYIESGRIEEGRDAARVPPLKGAIESYSGFFTVDPDFNSNLFFWFFPAETNRSEAPVVVWLQGGPGVTSLFGLFAEHGPYSITDEVTLEMREIYWSRELNVIYIDNPVGTGFSFTQNDAGYATNETTVGINLYRGLMQFFQLFPEFQPNRFFLTGESYAGKYIPATAFIIHENNPMASIKINMEGIALGNGWCDPENQLNYGDYLYHLGLIDGKTREIFNEMKNETVSLIKKGKFDRATSKYMDMVNFYGHVTGLQIHNYLKYYSNNDSEIEDSIESFTRKKEVRQSLHVGNATFHDNSKVWEFIEPDVMQSVKPWLQVIMNNYRVLLYNGQLDAMVAYSSTMNMIQKLEWNGKSDYVKAKRQQWITSNGDLAGYFKSAGNFTEVLVRKAGHEVPSDQPEWAFELIKSFTKNVQF